MTESNFILHDGFRRGVYKDDIALIRLPRKAELNGGTQLACLPLSGTAPAVDLISWTSGEVGRRTTVVGWGYSRYVEGTTKFYESEVPEVPTQAQQFLEVRERVSNHCYT